MSIFGRVVKVVKLGNVFAVGYNKTVFTDFKYQTKKEAQNVVDLNNALYHFSKYEELKNKLFQGDKEGLVYENSEIETGDSYDHHLKLLNPSDNTISGFLYANAGTEEG